MDRRTRATSALGRSNTGAHCWLAALPLARSSTTTATCASPSPIWPLKKKAPIDVEDVRTLNRCLDDAMAEAVTEFARQQETGREGDLSELWGLVNAASAAVEAPAHPPPSTPERRKRHA